MGHPTYWDNFSKSPFLQTRIQRVNFRELFLSPTLTLIKVEVFRLIRVIVKFICD